MKKSILIIIALFIFISCSESKKDIDNPITEPNLAEEVIIYQEDKLSNDLVLVNDAATDEVYLLKKNGEKFHEWTLNNELGNDAFLEEDGKLLALLKTGDDKIKFGGYGGQIQSINPDNSINWQFKYSTEDYNLHHDIERLPNGNIVALLWEKKTNAEAKEKGYKGDSDVFIESIIEINPNNDQIVWKWSSWNHIIQDFDQTKSNFGSVANNPQLVDINYNVISTGDIMHANAIEYDKKNDLIFVSINFYNEIWVLDHSTNTKEATTSTGGNFNKGGNLLYRFGNPSAHKASGNKLFDRNHHCNFIDDNLPGAGNLLVFNNGFSDEQSTVLELKLPTPSAYDFNLAPKTEWSFTNPDLFSGKVSGAIRTKNGNTLITEGDFGFWEISQNNDIVWQYSKSGFFWRGYPYEYDNISIINLKK